MTAQAGFASAPTPPTYNEKSVKRTLLTAIAAATCLVADDKWIRLRSGPFEVLSNAGEKLARDRLYDAEQFRHALGDLLGKKDLSTVWPIRILALKDKRLSVPNGMALGRDSWIGASADEAWRRACARVLIDDNTLRLPAEIERGIIALISTLEINGTRLALGAPPAERTRDWVRVRLLATAPDYRGRLRVFISNLEQGGGYDVAYRNAFEKRAAEIEKQVDAAMSASPTEAVPVPGRALSEKDFTVREALPHEGAVALADLAAVNPSRAAEVDALYKAAGGVEADEHFKRFPAATAAGTKNPRAWLGLDTRDGFLKAAELNPRWSEPHMRLAALETDPGRKATYLQKAANAEPRNAAIWKAFALALTDARQFAMAAKAWTSAEFAAQTEQERASMHQARLDIEIKRADYEESERKKRLEAEARDLARVKNLALAEIREAEASVNNKLRNEHGDKPEEVVKLEDLDKPNRLEGKLERVECLAKGQARLTVRTDDKKTTQFMILNPTAVAIGGGQTWLGCGILKPARTVVIEYLSARDVQSIEFK